jgi:hypothetical protein
VKRHEVSIREHTFHIRRFDPFTAVGVLGDLQREFGGPLLASLKGSEGEARARGADALFGALAKLSADMDGPTLEKWAKRLLNQELVAVSVSGAEAKKMDKIAAEQCELTAGEIIHLCTEVVRFNFEDFIERLRGLISSGVSRLLESQLAGSAPK